MKKFLLAVAVLCMGTMAFAGPNAGGTLIAHDANLLMSGTNGSVSICGQGSNLDVCEAADTEIDGADTADPAIFKVYAAFIPGSSPRLMGITWGINYDGGALILPAFGKCGDFELNDDTWPAAGSGSTVTWNTVQTSYLVPVYWFAAYQYYGAASVLQLGPNPSQGGVFGDDSVPAVLDPIAGYGAMGFGMPGAVICPFIPAEGACCDPATGGCTITAPEQCSGNFHPEWTSCDPNPCPPPPPPFGACCDPDTGNCTLTIEVECAFVWHPEWTSCDPNPCPPPVPAQQSTWGQIKANYR